MNQLRRRPLLVTSRALLQRIPFNYYAVVPYPNCPGCLGQLGTLDTLSSISSHELAEGIIDPILGQEGVVR